MNYAVLCDLNSIKISFETFNDSLNKLDGKIIYSKFYGYVAKKNNDFLEYVKKYTADICIPLQNRKKIRVDIRQVIDSIMLACTNKNIDGLYLICSEVDALPMIQALKTLNKKVVIGVTSKTFLSEQADEIIYLDRMAGLIEEDEFLPYTNIVDDKNELSDIKKELKILIDEKRKQIECENLKNNNIDVENLIKRYF